MFGFFKKSKSALANKIIEISLDAANQFLNYLREDTELYSKCINDNPIKTTSAIFVVNFYRDMLNSKYNTKDVFVVIRTVILSMADDKATQDLLWKALMDYTRNCNEAVEYYKQFDGCDIADVLTKMYFSFVIDDREYLEAEFENAIPQSVSYKKIYNYINGTLKNPILLNEKYNLRLEK